MIKLPKVSKEWQNDLRKLPICEATWVDATIVDGWRSASNIDHTNIEVKTVGWFFPPTKTQIRLGYSITNTGDMNELFLIPRTWVRKVKVLR